MITSHKKLIILDRDGVINHDSPDYIKSPEEWMAIPGSLEAIAKLNRAGFLVVIASNQSGVGRGLFSLEMLDKIHEHMKAEAKKVGAQIDGIFFCPHHPDKDCDCRKPRPGLLEQIAAYYHTPLAGVPCVGDSARDIWAAQKAGAQPYLVLTGNGKKTVSELMVYDNLSIYEDLASLVEDLLSHPGVHNS